jgi:hypothetical protein
MREITLELHREAPAKPAEGQPCNGCGVCCALETCPLGRLRFLQIRGPCPALHWSATAGRYHCGLLLAAGPDSLFGRLCTRWISAGSGCDCNAEVQR